jgi:hypothetical protein
MNFWNSVLAGAIGLAMTLALPSTAQAIPVTYEFSVTATTGPLTGATASGTFTYDTSSIVPSTLVRATGLLTDLNFTWNGITYDETTANTGALSFDATGTLTNEVFGHNCFPGFCVILLFGDDDQWSFDNFGPMETRFDYFVPGAGDGTGTISRSLVAAAVPAPSALALLALGLVGLTSANVRRRCAGL